MCPVEDPQPDTHWGERTFDQRAKVDYVPKARSNNTVMYRRTYHVAWCPKNRRRVIDARIDTRSTQLIQQVRAEPDAPIIELDTAPNHVHLLVTANPQYSVHRQVTQIEGSRPLRHELPHPNRGHRPCGPTPI